MLKTSFFNKAVFKRNLHGYWPLWAAYLGAMILIIPVPLYSSLQYGYYETAEQITISFFSNALTTSLVLGAFFAIFATMAVFSYMYTTRAANMTASLPVRREALFGTNFLTVLFITAASHLIIAVITAVMIALINIKLLFVLPILQWLVLGILMTLFFICLSFFCATLTGSILILPCIYGVINFSAVLINTLATNIFADFLYGYSYNSVPEFVLWLTPSVKLLSIAADTYSPVEGASYVAFSHLGTIVIYTVIGLALLIAALLIHKNRRTESASDIVAVKPLKPVVKYFFAGIGSLTLGLFINEIFFFYLDGSVIGYVISMIIGGFIGYFASEMLVSKSFKVWHKWKGFLIYCAVIILFLVGLAFDIAGFETAIPHDSSIQSATINIYGNALEGTDEETIDTITQAHQYIIDNRNKEIDYEEVTASVNITYVLNGGTVVERSYFCNIPDFIVNAYNSPGLCYKRIAIPESYISAPVINATVEYYNGEVWAVTELTSEQFYALYNCMIKDIGTSSIGTVEAFNEYIPEAVTISAEFVTNEYSGYYYYYKVIPVDAANCISYLESLDISYNKN